MDNPDDKHPTRTGFEPITSEFRATTGSNEPPRRTSSHADRKARGAAQRCLVC